jgi:hypothetical protein
MTSLDNFGFLYMIDYDKGTLSHPITQCKTIDPIGYKAAYVEDDANDKALFNKLSVKSENQPEDTNLHIDKFCSVDTLFKTVPIQQKFLEYISANCYNQHRCTLDPSAIKIDGQSVTFASLINNDCVERISTTQITSPYYLATLTCDDNNVHSPFKMSKN